MVSVGMVLGLAAGLVGAGMVAMLVAVTLLWIRNRRVRRRSPAHPRPHTTPTDALAVVVPRTCFPLKRALLTFPPSLYVPVPG
jgi:uncharacterized iron-regulated membrane protein